MVVYILLSLYVNDMIITSDDVDGIVVLKFDLASHFEMKNLGVLWYFLGIEVAFSLKCYLLSQSKYTINILDWTHLTNTKTIDTPLVVNVRYSSYDGNPPCQTLLYIVLLLVPWSISPLYVWTLLMLSTLLVNLLLLL